MKTGVEMLPCPMCGGRADTGGHTGTIYVECQVCGVLGSCAIDEDGAIAAWNTRHTHPAATGSVREAAVHAERAKVVATEHGIDFWALAEQPEIIAAMLDYANERVAATAPTPDAAAPRCPTADELEAAGKAPWQGEQPIEEHARQWKGRPWVPLEAAISDLQFWQRRDYEHSRSASLATPAPQPASGGVREDQPGWIVGNNDGDWLTTDNFGWAWTGLRDLAIRFARQEDAVDAFYVTPKASYAEQYDSPSEQETDAIRTCTWCGVNAAASVCPACEAWASSDASQTIERSK